MPQAESTARRGGARKKLTRRERLGYRLAAIAGDPTLSILDELTPADAAGWQNYFRRVPMGDECLYLAILCAWFYNAHCGEYDSPMNPENVVDYVEWLKAGRPSGGHKQTQEQIAAVIKRWALSALAPM